MTGAELQHALGLHARANPDFFDSLVALRFLERDGDGPAGRYRNTPETAAFLDRSSPRFMGGFLEMSNARLYQFWGDLTDGLRTGAPQNELKHNGTSMFAELYSEPERLEQFMDAMGRVSAGNFQAFADTFDFSGYRTLCDVGGATGQLSMLVARKHPHMTCVSADLPEATRIAAAEDRRGGLSDRVSAQPIDFLRIRCRGGNDHDGHDPARLEPGDENAHSGRLRGAAAGGAFVVVENLIDDARARTRSG